MANHQMVQTPAFKAESSIIKKEEKTFKKKVSIKIPSQSSDVPLTEDKSEHLLESDSILPTGERL